MEQNDVIFDFKHVSPGYQLCFNSPCPRCNECLHYMAGQYLPEKRDWGPAIYPNMKTDDTGCRFYQTATPRRMASGFSTIYDNVLSKHKRMLRDTVKVYLGGHGNYYRYHRGEYLLNPEQQEWIARLFRQNGYQEPVVFDHYVLMYDFSH